MICRCFGRSLDVTALARGVGRAANLMVGMPDYDAYVAHLAAAHPERPAMTREAFVRDRQAARYGANGQLRCC